MKKFTHLLMMLCVFAGTAWAGPTDLPQITTDLENPIYYTIYNTRSTQPGGLMYYAGDEVGMKDGCTSPTLEDKYKFYFTGSHDALYVHNAATTKKLASVGNGDKAKGSWTDEGTVWAVGVSPKGGGLAFGPQGGLNGNGCWNECNYNTGDGNPDFTTWSANDAGSIFVVELASEYTFPETDKFYTIECPLFESVQNVKKGLYVTAEGALAWGTVDLTNKNHYWVPTVNVDNTVVLKNLGTGKYLNGTEMADAEVNATLNALSSTQFNIKVNGTTVHANGHGNGANASGSIVNYGGSANSASAWTFVEQEDPDATISVTIKYSFTYNGVEKYTQETSTLVGQEYPAITTTFPFGVSAAAKPEGTIPNEGIDEDGVKTVEIALSVNLPFVPATDYASITKWYYIDMRDDNPGNSYWCYDTSIDYIKSRDNLSAVKGSEDAHSWAFVGNPFDGFQIVNKAAGPNMILSAPSAPTGSKNENELARMVEASSATGNKVWNLVAPTHNNARANSFYIQHPTSPSYAFNRQSYGNGNTVCYWNSRDTGSAVWVVDDALLLNEALATAKEYHVALTENWQNAVGYVTADFKNNLSTAIATAETAIDNATGCYEALSGLQTLLANVEIIQPEEGKFYNIVSSCTKDHRANQQVYVDNSGVMHFARPEDARATSLGHVFQFVPGADGKFYIYNVERGVYMQTIGKASETDVANAKPVTIANMGKDNIVSIKPDGQNQMHAQDNNSIIVGWNNNAYDDGSAWKIVEVADINDVSHPVTITGAEWATLVLGCNTTIPAGVKAYAVSAVGDGYATLAEVTTGTIPANEAVLLNAAARTYEFKYAAESTPVENKLVGTVFNTNVTDNAYVLSAQGDPAVVGFYKAKFNVSTDTTNDGTTEEPAVTYEAFLNNAFKAYLPATTAESRFLVFNFGDDNATAIEGIEAENTANAVVYDLAGRRVQKAQKGLYIVNGKKVIK